MPDAKNETLQQMIAETAAYCAELDRIVNPSCTTIESHGWIVVYPDDKPTTAYSFTVKDKLATAPRIERASRCTRFTKEDAERVAASCTSPDGKTLIAMHYRDVCANKLGNLRPVLDSLEAA